MSTPPLRASALAACSVLAGCAAVLGLPDPALDEGVGPGAVDSGGSSGTTSSSSGSGPSGTDGAPAIDGSSGSSGTSGAIVDGGADAGPSCDLSRPFGEITPIGPNTANAEHRPSLTANERSIFFARAPSDSPQQGFLLLGRRAEPNLPFGQVQPIARNVVGARSPCVSSDGAVIYFSGGDFVGSRVYAIAQVDGGYPDGTEREEPALVSPEGTQCGSLLPGPSGAMYLHRGGDPADPAFPHGGLFRAARVNGAVQQPAPIPGLPNDGVRRFSPVIAADDRTLYFAQIDESAAAVADIWVTRRATPADPFDRGVRVDELSTPGDETPGWLSPDGCRIYFSRQLPGTTNRDLFVAKKPARQ
jgi:hypothetical protein